MCEDCLEKHARCGKGSWGWNSGLLASFGLVAPVLVDIVGAPRGVAIAAAVRAERRERRFGVPRKPDIRLAAPSHGVASQHVRNVNWDPSDTAFANLLAQPVVFKKHSIGCTAVPQILCKKINDKFGVEETPDWWSGELGAWAMNQRIFGKAFKKPASERSKTEKANASKTTKRRVALLDGIGFFT